MKTKKAADLNGLPRSPRRIDEHNWYYMEPEGLCFVHEVYTRGQPIHTDMFYIPKRQLPTLLRAVERYIEAPATEVK